MKKQLGLIAGALLVSTSCFAADSFQVETVVYKANDLLASPVMLVEEKQPATISIGEGFCASYQTRYSVVQIHSHLHRFVLKIPAYKID